MAEFIQAAASDFDFSKAPLYRKTALLPKACVEVAAARQVVATVIEGREETVNVAEIGDRIVTGAQGERYVIGRDRFDELYEADPADAGLYRSRNVVRALMLARDTELTAPWGERQRATAGGFVVQRVDRPADIYLIGKTAFETSYTLCSEDATK